MNRMWLLAAVAALTACSHDSGVDSSTRHPPISSSSSSSSSAASSSSTSSSSSSATSSGSPAKPAAPYLLPGADCKEFEDRDGFNIVYRCDLSSEPNGTITLVEAVEGSPEIERVFRLHYEEAYQLTQRDDENLIVRLGYAEGDGALKYVTHQDLYYLLSGELVLMTAIRAPVDATKRVQISSLLVQDPEPVIEYSYSEYEFHQPWAAVGSKQVLVADHHMLDREGDGACEVYSTSFGEPNQDSGQNHVGITGAIYCDFTPDTAPIDAPVIAPGKTFLFKKYGPPAPAELPTP